MRPTDIIGKEARCIHCGGLVEKQSNDGTRFSDCGNCEEWKTDDLMGIMGRHASWCPESVLMVAEEKQL